MLLSLGGVLLFAIAFGLNFIFRVVDSGGMWFIGVATLGCIGLSFRGTLREVYVFDRPSGTYRFVRQWIYKREVIEGTISQFCGVGVHTHVVDDSETHSVILRQRGLLLGQSPEQPIRETTPALNSWETEARIAQAIHKFLKIPRVDG